VTPLLGLALAPPEPSPLHDLEGRSLQVDQHTQPPILGRWQRAVLVGGVPAGGARLPIAAPCGHMGLERGLKGRDQQLKLFSRQAGPIQHLLGASLDVGEP
jgi:hypothetical protein